jgi:hypothetical protein
MIAVITSQLNYAKLLNGEKPLLERSTLYAKKIADDLGIIPKNVREQREFIKDDFTKVFDSIDEYPRGSINAPEMFMPTLTLEGFGTIDAFPIGIGNRELLVVPFTDVTFQEIEISLYGLVPPANRILWSNAILKGINNSYEFISKSSGTFGHVAIYRKVD